MHQRTRRLAILFGGSLLAALGLVLAACSTDNGATPVPTTGTDSGRDTKGKDSGKDPGDDEDSGGGAKDAGVDCSTAPHLRSNTGVFCFGGTGTDDGGMCSADENKVCCGDAKDETGKFIKAYCAVATKDSAGGYAAGSCDFAPDAGGREWHCSEDDQCPNAGEACCVIKGTGGTPKALDDKDFPGCGTYYNGDQGFNVGGTRCRKGGTCEAGELKLCSKDADCDTGTCHPFKLANRYTGVCQ